MEFLDLEIQRLGISITREYHLNGRMLVADPDLLHQAFLNLLINAIQAMPGGGRLTVSTQAGPQGRGGEIRFADTGDGIEPESLKKVLNPFFTTKEKGSGLGLPIVREIAELHRALNMRPMHGEIPDNVGDGNVL